MDLQAANLSGPLASDVVAKLMSRALSLTGDNYEKGVD
jgi:hypothetical protein